jgi:hypothetical protein
VRVVVRTRDRTNGATGSLYDVVVEAENAVVVVRRGIRDTGELTAVEAHVREDVEAGALWLVRAVERAEVRQNGPLAMRPTALEFDWGAEDDA